MTTRTRDTAQHDLAATLFLAQDERPDHLVDIKMAELCPELRVLLCYDGTLTTALEACQLGPIGVDVQIHGEIRLDEPRAHLVRVASGTDAVARRVAIRDRLTARLLVVAESLLLLNRLPKAFAAVLATSPKGLGDALTRLKLESRRELLWYGRAVRADPAMSDDVEPSCDAVVRCYRVICGGHPVLLVEESFPLR